MLDEIGQCRVPSKLPQMCRKTTKKQNLQIQSPARAPKCLTPPPKMLAPYSRAICPPKIPPSLEKESPLLHREKNGFLKGLYFGISTRTTLESPKSDMCQNGPERVLGNVISCPEPKFEKEIPMGSVPNERKEIMRDPIRWFKCKLKPPKNWFCEDPWLWPKYSNGSGVAKNSHMSKLTKRGPRRYLKLSWDKIWQQNSNGKFPKMPKRDSHAPRY